MWINWPDIRCSSENSQNKILLSASLCWHLKWWPVLSTFTKSYIETFISQFLKRKTDCVNLQKETNLTSTAKLTVKLCLLSGCAVCHSWPVSDSRHVSNIAVERRPSSAPPEGSQNRLRTHGVFHPLGSLVRLSENNTHSHELHIQQNTFFKHYLQKQVKAQDKFNT